MTGRTVFVSTKSFWRALKKNGRSDSVLSKIICVGEPRKNDWSESVLSKIKFPGEP